MDPRIQSDPELSIRRAKKKCFQRIHDSEAQQDPPFPAHAQGLEQMLQLWAKHSGVDSRKGMSLDDRLEDHPDLKESIIGLLELIEQKITQALSSPDDYGNAESPPAIISIDDAGVDPEKFLIKQKWRGYSGNPWETAGAAVDMLIELTAMIRKSTVRNSSLPTHFHRPDDYFAEYAKLLARNWFKDARRSLTDQLGDSVFVRRRQMLYKMKHEEKIMYPETHLDPLPVEPTPDPLPTREVTPEMEPPKKITSRVKPLRPVVPIFANPNPSSTNLSQLDRTRLKHKQHGQKFEALSGITEGSLSIEEAGFSYMYPEPPTLGEKQRYGVCPYCSTFLPSSKLTKEAWRKHLHEDLQPYACISEKCQDTLRLFSNSQQWLQHMDDFHGNDWPQKVHMKTWYCDRDHDRVEFKSESELHGHLIHDHASLSEAHVSALVRRNWGVGCREAHVCPLCESTPSNIVPLMNNKDKASLLFQHIGDHLKGLALFSLPPLSTDPANDEQKSSSGAQLPTNDDSKGSTSENSQILAQVDEDLEGSLTFNDDPHNFMDDQGSETAINEEHAANVPSDLDTKLEWNFASSEHEAIEQDPILQNLRKHGENQQAESPEELYRRAYLFLGEQIRKISLLSVFDDPPSYFLPNGALNGLVTRYSVYRELRVEPSSLAQDKTELESLVEFVLASARRLFAAAIMVGQSCNLLQERMQCFQDKGITDSCLPLQVSWWEENYWHESIKERTARMDAMKPRSEGLWPLEAVERFCLVQRMFLAPVFSDTGLSYDFGPDTILPFTERGPNIDLDEFGRGTRYRIHERHIDQQNMVTGRPYYVDVKEVPQNLFETDPSWKRQIEMLSQTNSLNHEHIVRFLATFRRDWEKEYLMFESAGGGNLRDLWCNFYRPTLTSGLVKSAFRQMVGLTNAIHHIHYSLTSRHGDLRPDNILCFNDDNEDGFVTLKIGGWGHWGRVKRMTGPWVDEYERMYGTPKDSQYEAPEIPSDRDFSRPRSRLSDIWSFGCVMLEFLIWLMYGVVGLERFTGALHTTESFHKTKKGGQGGIPVVTVAPVVLAWMDHMAADTACEVETTALGNFLELIRTRLLVVELPQGSRLALSKAHLKVPAMPHSSAGGQSHQARERCSSNELEMRMRKILDENQTERYWLAAQPKPPPEIRDGMPISTEPNPV